MSQVSELNLMVDLQQTINEYHRVFLDRPGWPGTIFTPLMIDLSKMQVCMAQKKKLELGDN